MGNTGFPLCVKSGGPRATNYSVVEQRIRGCYSLGTQKPRGTTCCVSVRSESRAADCAVFTVSYNNTLTDSCLKMT